MSVSRLSLALGRLIRGWREDRSGATLIQFVAVLPAFILLVYGTYVVWEVMSARDRLCNAAWQASRYLQVEGPRFPEGTVFPDDWAKVALDFLKEEAAGSQLLSDQTLDLTNVVVWGRTGDVPHAPGSPEESTVDAVEPAQFAVRFTVDLPHPFPRMWAKPDATPEEEAARGRLKLTCQRFGFAEDPPFKATEAGGPSCPPCNKVPCTPGAEPTRCQPPDGPACPTPERCPCPCDR